MQESFNEKIGNFVHGGTFFKKIESKNFQPKSLSLPYFNVNDMNNKWSENRF